MWLLTNPNIVLGLRLVKVSDFEWSAVELLFSAPQNSHEYHVWIYIDSLDVGSTVIPTTL